MKAVRSSSHVLIVSSLSSPNHVFASPMSDRGNIIRRMTSFFVSLYLNISHIPRNSRMCLCRSVLILPSNWFPLMTVKWLPLIANLFAVSGLVIAKPRVGVTAQSAAYMGSSSIGGLFRCANGTLLFRRQSLRFRDIQANVLRKPKKAGVPKKPRTLIVADNIVEESIAIELAKSVSIEEQQPQQREIMNQLKIKRQVEKYVEDTYAAEAGVKLKATDSDATRDSLCLDTDEEKDDETDDSDDSNMDLSDDEPKGDDNAAGFGSSQCKLVYKEVGSADAAKRRTTWFDLLLKSDINQNEEHILKPSTVVMAKKLKELIQKDELTIADLEGAGLEKLKKQYKNDVELEYHVDQLKATVTGEKYATSLTNHFAARYHIQGIEDMIPDKSSKKIHNYQIEALNGIHNWEDGRHDFFKAEINNWRSDQKEYEFSYDDLPRLNLNDVEDMYLIKVLEGVNNEDIEYEDVEIEIDDDAELIFPYEVKFDKTPPPGNVSSDFVSSDSVSSDSESEHVKVNVAPEATIGTLTQEPYATHTFPRSLFAMETSRARARELEVKWFSCRAEIALLKSNNKVEGIREWGECHVEKKLVERFYMEMVRIEAVSKPPSDDEDTERPRKKSKKSSSDWDRGIFRATWNA
ncbi:hypothetical protein Tco_1081361 [Tanacetum coccineum]|uniref:Uncharacterized protein n=1 Tax=Tanacetum coccineum TaxID=301880 RepID=A0ABQ5HYI8_9ASTR